MRQAVNYAVDSKALERIYAGQINGTQQILPPGMPGYEQFELYPHDMDKAEGNDRKKPTRRTWTSPSGPTPKARTTKRANTSTSVLKELGFNTTLKIINADNYFTVIGNLSTPDLDTGWSDWFQDYPHPNDFFQPLLAGESILPTNNGNFAKIDDPALNKKIDEAGRRTARARAGRGLRGTRQGNTWNRRRGPPTGRGRCRPSSPTRSTSKASSSTRPSATT